MKGLGSSSDIDITSSASQVGPKTVLAPYCFIRCFARSTIFPASETKRSASPVERLADIEFAGFIVLEPIQKDTVVPPWNLCTKLVLNYLVGPLLFKFAHVFEVADRIPGKFWKFPPPFLGFLVDRYIIFDMFSCVKHEVQLMEPAIGFIQELSLKMRAKVLRAIGLLEEFGPQLPAPHSKTLKGCEGLKELRVKLGSDIVRLFYFHHKGKTYVVTSGYVKKTQKTNQREIDRALRLMNGFIGGENHG